MSAWKKIKINLGLAADEEYDDAYDTGLDLEPGAASELTDGPVVHSRAGLSNPGSEQFSGPVMKPIPRSATPPRPTQRSVVRPIPAATNFKPHIITPDSFNDAQDIGDKYRSGQPVVMDIHDLDRGVSRRLIDFASGLCFGLGGQMEKIIDHVYLLTPSDVEVSAEERKRLRERSADND